MLDSSPTILRALLVVVSGAFGCSDPSTAVNAGAGAGAGSAGTGTAAGTGGSGAAGSSAVAGGGAPVLDAGIGSELVDASTNADAANRVDAAIDDDALVGWAAVSGDGDDTTRGGGAGMVVQPKDATELQQYAASAEPLVIELHGSFVVPRLQLASHKTLRGVGPDAKIEGGIRIRGKDDELVHDVIVQNLTVDAKSSDVDGDGVQIHYAHHVWVDHCDIFDAPDGNLDVVHASNWVTVSWTKFHYTSAAPDPKHRFSNLVGHTDDNEEDEGRLKVTFHHNEWGQGVIERMPRVRHGQVHVFDNAYTATGNNYAIGAGYQSSLRIENNAFQGVNDPHIFYDDEPTAQIVASGNLYAATSGAMSMGQGSAFTPPYPYVLDAAADVIALTAQHAGPH